MRPSIEAGSTTWPMRIFRPWVVASVTGFGIGAALLSFDAPEATPGHYPEFAPRAAAYDVAPLESMSGTAAAGAGPISTTRSGKEPLFAPAAPITSTTAAAPEITPGLGVDN